MENKNIHSLSIMQWLKTAQCDMVVQISQYKKLRHMMTRTPNCSTAEVRILSSLIPQPAKLHLMCAWFKGAVVVMVAVRTVPHQFRYIDRGFDNMQIFEIFNILKIVKKLINKNNKKLVKIIKIRIDSR